MYIFFFIWEFPIVALLINNRNVFFFRLELEHLEREKREREIRELRERELNDRLKEEIMKSGMRGPANPMDPHWLEIQRRYAAAGLAGPGGNYPYRDLSTPNLLIKGAYIIGPGGMPLHHFALYPGQGGAQLSQMERERLERLGIPPPPGGPGQPGGPPPGHPHHPAHQAQLEAAERLALATDPMVRTF